MSIMNVGALSRAVSLVVANAKNVAVFVAVFAFICTTVPATVFAVDDTTAPTLVLSTAIGATSPTAAIPVTATWSEVVTGFTASDITVVNGSISNFAGSASSYSFTLTATNAGSASVSVAAAKAKDLAANDNTASNVLAVTYNPNAFNTGLVSITFDDGYDSTYDNRALLGPYTGTMYVNSDTMLGATAGGGCGGFTCYSAYMPTSEVVALHDAGHEIAAHTRTHLDLTTLTLEQLLAEVDGNRLDLLNLDIDAKVVSLAYPFGSSDPEIVAKLQSAGFTGARTVSPDELNDKTTDHFGLFAKQVNKDTSIATVQGWIDEAIAMKQWLILVVHEIETDCGSEDYCTTPTEITGIVSYLQTHEVGMDVVTMSQGLALMNGTPISDGFAPTITQPNLTVPAVNASSTPVAFTPVVTDLDTNLPSGGLNALCTIPNIVPHPISNLIFPTVITSGHAFPMGTTTVTCTAADTGGNLATKLFTVAVTDSAPVITLTGDAVATVEYGAVYTDAGATALDAIEGNLTASIVTVNPVNTLVLGDYTVTYNVSDTQLHAATQVTRLVHVIPRAVTATADAAGKTFGDADPALLTYALTNGALVGADVFTGSLVRAAGEAAGAYAITQGTLTLTPNYTLTFVPGTFTVAPAPGDIALSDLAVTYDGVPHEATVTSIYPYTVTYDGSSTIPTNAGSYAVVATIIDADHTGVANGTLVIHPVSITVTPDSLVKAYGAVDPALTYGVAGSFIGTDTFLTTVLSRAPGEAIAVYAITGTFTASANYAVTIAPATFSIVTDPNNLPAAANSQTVSVNQNSSVVVTLGALDSEGASLVWNVGEAAHGTLTGTAPDLTYTPATDYYGADSFTFSVHDGNSDSNTGTVSITVNLLPTCAEGYTLNGGVCVPNAPVSSCPTGFVLDAANNECDATPVAPTQCAEGFTLNGAVCAANPVPANQCDAGFHFDGTSLCVSDTPEDPTTVLPTCPVGTTALGGGMCQPSETETPTCAVGFTEVAGLCVAPSQGVPACPSGSTAVEGQPGMCTPATIPAHCISGYHLESTICVVDVPAAPSGGSSSGGGGSSRSLSYGVTINGGAAETDSANVTLALKRAKSTATKVWVSNTSDFTSGAWETYASSISWTLLSGEGEKTVYVRFGSASNSILSTKSDTIDLTGAVLGVTTDGVSNDSNAGACYVFAHQLMVGMSGEDVTKLQERLTAEGVYTGPITGYFGPVTRAGVEAFQVKAGIDPHYGYVGPLTLAKLNESCTSATTEGASVNDLEAQIEILKAQIAAFQKIT